MKHSFTLRELALQSAIAGAYFIAGKLCLQFAYLHPSASPIWAPTGIALAAMIVFGRQVWPAILIGAFAVNASTFGPLFSSVGIAVGNTLEALVGSYLFTRFTQGHRFMERPRDVLSYLFFTGLLSTTISATVGVISLLATGAAQPTQTGVIWATWWLGDIGGSLIVAPAVILWLQNWRIVWSRTRWLEAILLTLTISAFGLLVFSGLYVDSHMRFALKFLCIPPIIWVAYRFGQRETASAVLLLSLFALWGGIQKDASLMDTTPTKVLLLLQMFLGVIATTAYLLASVVEERERGEQELKQTNTALEERVEERTLSLSRTIADLRLEILQRKEMERSLRDSQEKFRLLVDAVKDYAIYMLDPDGKIISWNDGAERLKGYASHEVLGKHLSIFYTKEEVERGTPNTLLKIAATKGQANQVGLRVRKDGSKFWADVMISPLYDKEGKLRGFAKITRDVTERRKSEAALMESQERFKQLLGSNFIGFMLLSEDGSIEELNDAMLKMLGYTREEMVQQNLSHESMTPSQYHLLDQWMHDRLKTSGMCPPMEKEFIRKDGCRVPVLLGMVQLLGIPAQRLCFVIDVSERRSAQDAMRKAYDELEVRVQQRTAELQEEVIRRQRAEEELLNQATRDALTGLYNRRGFMTLAEKHFDLARRQQKPLLLFMADLDDLKHINDTFGHSEGDAALIKSAEILMKTFRQSDIVTRIGGDEFAVMGMEESEETERDLIGRLQVGLDDYNRFSGKQYVLRLSVGTARIDVTKDFTLDHLIRQADASLYEQKKHKPSSYLKSS